MNLVTRITWKGLDDPTFEHCTITHTEGRIHVQSKIEGSVNNVHTIAEYELELDTSWTVISAQVAVLAPEPGKKVKLTHNKYGEWVDEQLRIRPDLEGCMDVDITLTPFTNTLPIKRMCFKAGESKEINVVYFDLPGFDIRMVKQRYTYQGNNVFRFDALDTGYTNTITFNVAGFVQDYPGLFSSEQHHT